MTHLAIRADVTDQTQVEDYSRSVTDRLGGIDFFFNNAGILGRVGPFLEYPDDEFDRIVATNLKSVWLAMKILTPLLVRRGGGVIVNTASVAGLRGYREMLAYCATKHAVVGTTRAAAAELPPRSVSTLCALASSKRQCSACSARAPRQEHRRHSKNSLSRVPAARFGSAAEVAAVAAFLLLGRRVICDRSNVHR